MDDEPKSEPSPDVATVPAVKAPRGPPPTGRGATAGIRRRLRPRCLTLLAVGCVTVPFGVILVRVLAAPGYVYLSDDLALIDVRVRDALVWKQTVGPYDHYGWNHPGPSFFYLLSVPARLLGAGAKADVVGATLVNALCAVAVIWLVRRRCSSQAALWSAVCLAFLAIRVDRAPHFFLFGGGSLEAVTSPWNPAVVLFPLVLVGVLCADAAAGTTLALLGAALVGSVVAQTDLSAAPLVVVLLVAAAVVRAAGVVAARRLAGARDERHSPAAQPTAAPRTGTKAGRARLLWAGGLALLVTAWMPPLIEELTGHPGNLTKIWRFFTAHHRTHSFSAGFRALSAVDGIFTSSGRARMHRSTWSRRSRWWWSCSWAWVPWCSASGGAGTWPPPWGRPVCSASSPPPPRPPVS